MTRLTADSLVLAVATPPRVAKFATILAISAMTGLRSVALVAAAPGRHPMLRQHDKLHKLPQRQGRAADLLLRSTNQRGSVWSCNMSHCDLLINNSFGYLSCNKGACLPAIGNHARAPALCGCNIASRRLYSAYSVSEAQGNVTTDSPREQKPTCEMWSANQ